MEDTESGDFPSVLGMIVLLVLVVLAECVIWFFEVRDFILGWRR